MKQVIFMCCALIICAAASLAFSQQEPLTNGLVIFAEQAANGTHLLGVKDKKGKVIVPADRYQWITSDDLVILCQKSQTHLTAYKVDGTLLSKDFEEYWKNETIYEKQLMSYAFVSYDYVTYYFPSVNEVIKAADIPTSPGNGTHMFIPFEDHWELRTVYGMFKMRLPMNFTIILDDYANTVVAIDAQGGKSGGSIYNQDGILVRSYNAEEWAVLKKRLGDLADLDYDNSEVYLASVNDITDL